MDVVVCDAVETNQRYLPNTAVLETIDHATETAARCALSISRRARSVSAAASGRRCSFAASSR